MLDAGDHVVELHARTQPFGERLGQFLVAAIEMECLAFRKRNAARLHHGDAPHAVERVHALPIEFAARPLRGAQTGIERIEIDRVEFVEAIAERLARIAEAGDHLRQIERRQFVPRIARGGSGPPSR